MKLSDYAWIKNDTNLSGRPILCPSARAIIGNYICVIHNISNSASALISTIDQWYDVQLEIAHKYQWENGLNKILTLDEYLKLPGVKSKDIMANGSVFLYGVPLNTVTNIINYLSGSTTIDEGFKVIKSKPEEKPCITCKRANYINEAICWWCGNKPF